MKTADYEQIEAMILNTPKFGRNPGLNVSKRIYELLGKPGKNAAIIHVAGTNGKGSVCAYLNSVLTEAGYKTGMFTSPHLVSVRERIRCNHEWITKEEFSKTFELLQEKLNSIKNKVKAGAGKGELSAAAEAEEILAYTPVFYELLFFMAMIYFEEKNADIIILETGLGGRLDATNVIEEPKVTVITEIGMDHMEYLGDTYEKIAKEKAGIIKKGCRVVYSPNRQEVIGVIEQKGKEQGVLCKKVEKPEKHKIRFVDKMIDFSFFSRYYGYVPIRLSTGAVYQIENASLALTALEELEVKISREHMQRGILNCKWEGRMEEVMPGVYLDGAHNEDGIDAFLSSVREDGCTGRRWLLFSAAADKDYVVMKEKVMDSKLFDVIYTAPLQNARTIAREELKRLFKSCEVRITDSAWEGFGEMLSKRKENDFVYAAGSLYLVGEIKRNLS